MDDLKKVKQFLSETETLQKEISNLEMIGMKSLATNNRGQHLEKTFIVSSFNNTSVKLTPHLAQSICTDLLKKKENRLAEINKRLESMALLAEV